MPPIVTGDTSITGIVPTLPAGTAADVGVMNPDGQGAIVGAGYTYPADTAAPTVTATALVNATSYSFGSWARGTSR